MIDKRIETIDQHLDRKHKENKKKKSEITLRIVALVLVLTTALSGLAIGISRLIGGNKNKSNASNGKKSSVVKTVGLDDLGEELSFPADDKLGAPILGNVTGDIDINQIVVGKDPITGQTIIWKDQQAKENSKNIGKTEIDTKGGTLEVTQDGTVREVEQGYEVKDEKTDEVVSSGNGNVPEGKVWDSEVNAYVDPSEVGKYIICTQDYKDPETGEIVFAKGELVEKTVLARFEEYVRLYNSRALEQHTESTIINEEITSVSEEITSVNEVSEEVVSSDGYYTINGLTFQSKADYDQWVIQGYEGYALVDGIMMSQEAIDTYEKSLNR